MKINLIREFKTALNKAVTKQAVSSKDTFGSVDYTIPQIPCIIERKQDPWVLYGENNLYPLQVSDLRNGSAIHNSIIKTKVKMTAGNGFLINGAINEVDNLAKYNALSPDDKLSYDLFLKNPHDKDNMQTIVNKLADDFQEQGQFAYEVVYNVDFTKIVRIKYLNVDNIRAGKMEGNEVKSYWYCRNWSLYRKPEYKPFEIFVFNEEDKEHLNQIVFEKVGNQDYYGELPYKGALTWIQTDFKMGIYHLSNIDNGMNPGLWFKFYKLPSSENDKQSILDDLKSQYQGAGKVGTKLVTFSDGKDLAPDISPIQTSNLDKQLLLLAELCDKKILTGHQLTSPLLAGVSISGQLGGNTELKTAYQIFDNTVMAADRNMLSDSLQRVLNYNKTKVKIEINPFDPFKVRETKLPTEPITPLV